MSASWRTVQVLCPTTGTLPVQQTITVAAPSIGTPKAVLIIISSATAADTVIDGCRMGYGFTDGITQRGMSAFAQDADASPSSGMRDDNATLIQMVNGNATTLNGEARWTGWVTDGMTIEWDDLPNATFVLTCVFFYGTGFQAFVADFTSSGTQDVEAFIAGCPFAPNAVLNLSTDGAFTADHAQNSARIGLGLACRDRDGTTYQVGHDIFERNAPTIVTNGAHDIRDDSVHHRIFTSAAGLLTDGPRLQATSWTADGIGYTLRGSAGAIAGPFMLMNFGNARQWAGIPTMDTTAVATVSVTAPGFTPIALMCVATDLNAKNGPAQSSRQFAVGAGTVLGNVQHGAAWQSEDGLTTSDTRGFGGTEIISVVDDTGIGWDWNAALSTFTATGFDIIIGDASTVSRMAWFWVVSETPFDHNWLPEAKSGARWRRRLARM